MRLEVNNNIINLKSVEKLVDDRLLCIDFNDKKYILEFINSLVFNKAYNILLENGFLPSWRYTNWIISIST